MGIISVSLPTDGSTADVSDYNTPITTIVGAINGNLDSNNIASVSGTKITAGTLPGSTFDASTAGGWIADSATYTYSANNGNKEFVLGTSRDTTGYLSPGMKFKVTRGTTPSTQCMSFTASSSQYATNASPSGITFTGAFTCEAWIKLNSYTGNRMEIVDKLDGAFTSGGWQFELTNSGQLLVQYGTGSSFTGWSTYQSVPLNQWVHVAAVVSSTASKTLQGIYINGTSVPTQSVASSATSLTQASVDLRIGAFSATPSNSYFDGSMYQVRVWSVAQSQASIQANMAIALTTATNLVFVTADGSFNDASGVGNNLTAQNSASAAATGNPYNTTEYATILNVTSSTVTVSTGSAGSIPNMTLNSPQYSVAKNPYGLPSGLNVLGNTILQANQTSTSTSYVAISGLSVLTYLTAGQKVRVILDGTFNNSNSGIGIYPSIFAGSVSSSNLLKGKNLTSPGASFDLPVTIISEYTAPTTGAITFNAGYKTDANTITVVGAANQATEFRVELIE